MTTDPLESLLKELNQGRKGALGRTFALLLPYLRAIIRKRLPRKIRAKFDSIDVVQSVWAGLLQGLERGRWHFATPGHLRAFLVQVAQRRLLDHLRHYRIALSREEALVESRTETLPARDQAQPGDLAAVEDLWEHLLGSCPPEHQEILCLRRRGLSILEISQRTGMHEGSVRRVLRKLASQVAFPTAS